MADQSDIETRLVAAVAAALCPQGFDQPSAIGAVCRVFRGWPTGAALDADLAAGVVTASVVPVDGSLRNTTRYPAEWSSGDLTAPTMQAVTVGTSATFIGQAGADQLAGLLVDQRSYAYAVAARDTPAMVAAQLAVRVRADRIATVSGATVTVPGAGSVTGRVVGTGTAQSEVRRQVQDFRVTCWCPSPALRDAAASAIDLAMAQLTFLDLPDGSQARPRLANTTSSDRAQNAHLYRRDLTYSVEYPTTVSQAQAAMLFGALGLGAVSLTV